MDYVKFIAFLLTVFFSGAAHALTSPEDARRLPLAQLAKKLLGETGSLMIDVDRPKSDEKLRQIRFYSRATLAGSQFGICGASWVTIDFEDSGAVEKISSEGRYGVTGDIYRAPKKWTYDEYGELCKGVRSTRKFFPAPNSQAALEMAWYLDAISGKGPFAKQNFAYTCTGLCASEKNDLKWLTLEQIDDVRPIDCTKSDLKRPICFEIIVGADRIGPYPKIFWIYGTAYMNEVIIERVVAHVASSVP